MQRLAICCALVVGLAGTAADAAVPNFYNFSGHLETAGGEFTGSISIEFKLYTLPSGGTAFWNESQTVSVDNGRFHVVLGDNSTLITDNLSGGTAYVGVTVGNDAEMSPRVQLMSVPYATYADDAEKLGGVAAAEYSQGPHTATSPSNVATVSASGGDYTGLKAAVDDVATWCTGATAENRCLIRLMPGTYALAAKLTIPANMGVEGSGAEHTVISRTAGSSSSYTSGAVLQMSNETSLRGVTIRNTGGGLRFVNGLYMTNARVRLHQVTIDVSGAGGTSTNYHYGIRANNVSNLVISETEITVSKGTGDADYSYGVYMNSASASSSLEVTRSHVDISGSNLGGYGLITSRTASYYDVTITMSGTSTGIYSSGETTTVERCRITSDNYAVRRAGTATIRVLSSRISGLTANAIGASITCINSTSTSDKTLNADCTETLSTTAVPIGAVISWFRPDTTTPFPKGFAICDGSLINDSRSPWDGKQLPSLNNKFVRGVTSEANIGTTGGSDSHTHTTPIDHDHPSKTSGSGGASHSHNYSKTHNHGSVNTGSATAVHNHIWAYFDANEKWITYQSNGSSTTTMIDWTDGIGNAGAGEYPVSVSTTSGSTRHYYTGDTSIPHTHSADVANYSSSTNTSGSTTASHTHSVNPDALTANATSTSGSSLPAYVGLLQIMRIY